MMCLATQKAPIVEAGVDEAKPNAKTDVEELNMCDVGVGQS